ncbi:MAG: hypothetical protein C0483_22955 [Pirellula sp.]|nr:hypothetical protein [Pirellula sp.]
MPFRLPLALLTVIAVVFAAFPAPAADAPSTVAPLMRLLQSGRLPEARKGTVVEMICSRGGPDDLAVMLASATSGEFDEPLTLKVLTLLADAVQVRKVVPSGDLESIRKLMKARPGKEGAAIQLSAVRLAALWKTSGVAEELQLITADDSATDDLRNAAIDGLAALGDASAVGTLKAIATSAKSSSLRFRAAAALTKLDLNAASQTAAETLASAAAGDEVGPLVDAFLVRKGGPEQWAVALASVKLTPDAAKLALRHMYSVGRSDAALSDVLSKAAGIALDQKPPTPEELRELIAEVAAKGDAEKGEAVFRRSDLSCQKCHSIARAGGQVGPELSAIGSISPVDYVANSILVPNLAVKEQFVTRVFATTDGRTITGIVIDRDDQRVNLRDATGALVTLPTADIDEEEEGKSLMPQGLTKFLTREELVDLIKFISELGRPGLYAIRSVPTVQRWRVLRNLPAELQGDVPNVEIFREFVLDTPPETWQSAYGTARGALPLSELGKPGETLFLQGEFKVVDAGEIYVAVDAPKGTQLWIDAEPFDAGASVRHTFTTGLHRLTLRTTIDANPQSIIRVEMSKPAGSKAQFDVVGGA